MGYKMHFYSQGYILRETYTQPVTLWINVGEEKESGEGGGEWEGVLVVTALSSECYSGDNITVFFFFFNITVF